jgi:predicted nucleic acid-binding protein
MLVDTNILIDVLGDDPEWANWSISQLQAQSMVHKLVINPIIYSELSLTFSSIEELDETLQEMDLPMLEMPKPALFLASKAFLQYRKHGGAKNNVLGDFFIGAHAAVSNFTILTRDTKRYSTYFPTVQLVSPNS